MRGGREPCLKRPDRWSLMRGMLPPGLPRSPAGRGVHAALALLALATLGLGGCATYPTASELSAARLDLAPAVVLDGRGRFREIFCAIAARDGAAPQGDAGCETLLWHLADEPAPGRQPRPLPPIDPGLRFFLVTGALTDCFGADALPYRAAVRQLAGQGITVGTIRVSGRSSASHNARQIAGVLAAASLEQHQRTVLMGYSKGAVDVLHFLDEFPDAARQVAAVVSLAGPVYGSPLAESSAWAYDHLLAQAFGGRCDPGDGGLVDSMLPEVRRSWLDGRALPGHVAYFSVGAFTTREHLARGLRASWRLLAGSDQRNDGQVLAADALIPGSMLLGFANSDHWGLALAIENELPYLGARTAGNPLPQGALLEAILRQVSEALEKGGES